MKRKTCKTCDYNKENYCNLVQKQIEKIYINCKFYLKEKKNERFFRR